LESNAEFVTLQSASKKNILDIGIKRSSQYLNQAGNLALEEVPNSSILMELIEWR